jgi:Swt1-like HEPN
MSDYLKILEQQEALRRAADPLWGVRSQMDAVNLAGVRNQIDATDLAAVRNQINAIDLAGVRNQINAVDLAGVRSQINAIDLVGVRNQINAIDLAGVRNQINAVDLPGVRNQINAIDLAGVRNQINAIDLPGVRNQINAVDLAGVRSQINAITSFRHPGFDEAASLAHKAIAADQLTSRIFSDVDLQLKMRAMNHAWLRPDATSSALGFAAMQTMGRALDQYRPFELDLALALRKNLGDWRDVVEPTLPTILDAQLRSGFYHERGFNPALTDFSEGAFADSAELAGLIARRPVESDLEKVDEDEIGLRRNKEAFDQLQRFETAIRRFIDARMRLVFGEKWVKQQTPQTTYESWLAKKEKAIKAGAPEFPLIEYADFSDYRIIIERSDNWNAVFQPIFGRIEDVRESLQRLQPVRIATMHARWITLDDEALLIFETKRLLKAFAKA